MSRLTGKEAFGLMEAYQAVYAPRELTEEQVWEGVENWVNSLLEEGYDLSDYTWEEMYENYITENPALLAPAIGSGAAAAPYVLPALGAAAALIKNNLNKTNKMVTTPDEERFLNTGQLATKRLDPQEKIRRKDARAAERERLKKIKDSESNTNVPSPTKPPVKTDPPKVDPPKVDPPKVDPPKVDPPKVNPPVERVKPSSLNSGGRAELIQKAEAAARREAAARQEAARQEAARQEAARQEAARQEAAQKAAAAAQKAAARQEARLAASKTSLKKEPPAQKIDPLQTVKDIGKNIPGIGKLVRNTLGQPARERVFGTTRSGQVVRGLGTAGAVGLDVRGNLSDPTGTTKSTTAQVGSIGPGTVGNVLRSTGALFGGDKPSGGSGLARGAYETGKDLQRLGQRMLDQPRTKKLMMSYEPEGNILLERENIITEGPDWNSVPKPKGVVVRTLGNERKVFIPGQGWQFPATARRWARSQGFEDWDKIPNPSQPQNPQAQKPAQLAQRATQQRLQAGVVQGGEAGFRSLVPKPTPQKGESAEKFKARQSRYEDSQRLAQTLTQSQQKKAAQKAAEAAAKAEAEKAKKPPVDPPTTQKPEPPVDPPTTKNPPVPPTTKNPPVPPTTKNPPVVPPTTQKPPVVPPTKPQAQTGDRTKDLTTWANANKNMINTVGTPQQKAILSAAEKGTAMPAPRPISNDIEDIKKMQTASRDRQGVKESYDAYDLVLEYLLSQGHTDTIEEAHYVMMEMDEEIIGNIIDQYIIE